MHTRNIGKYNDGDHQKMRKQKKKQKQTGHKRLLSPMAGTATSSPNFSGVSPLLRLSQCFAMQAHTYRMYMIVVLHP